MIFHNRCNLQNSELFSLGAASDYFALKNRIGKCMSDFCLKYASSTVSHCKNSLCNVCTHILENHYWTHHSCVFQEQIYFWSYFYTNHTPICPHVLTFYASPKYSSVQMKSLVLSSMLSGILVEDCLFDLLSSSLWHKFPWALSKSSVQNCFLQWIHLYLGDPSELNIFPICLVKLSLRLNFFPQVSHRKSSRLLEWTSTACLSKLSDRLNRFPQSVQAYVDTSGSLCFTVLCLARF